MPKQRDKTGQRMIFIGPPSIKQFVQYLNRVVVFILILVVMNIE